VSTGVCIFIPDLEKLSMTVNCLNLFLAGEVVLSSFMAKNYFAIHENCDKQIRIEIT